MHCVIVLSSPTSALSTDGLAASVVEALFSSAAAAGDRAELHDQTMIQEQALDGISDALGDLEMMSRVRAQPS